MLNVCHLLSPVPKVGGGGEGVGRLRYKLRSVKWRVIRHILLFKTRGKLEPECVSQVFVGSVLGTHRLLCSLLHSRF